MKIPGRHIGDITRRYSKHKPSKFYQTGIKEFDKFTGGLPTGEMTLIGGRPGDGKTALAMQMLENISSFHAEPTGIFSIEMTGQSLVTRMVISRTGLPSVALRKGELTAKQMKVRDKALEEIGKLPIYIDESSVATVHYIDKVARQWIKAGIKVLALDYIQLLSARGPIGDTRASFVGEAAWALKTIAKMGDVPFVVLSQLNRDSTKNNRPPTMADLKESGGLEQVADNVVLIHPDRANPPYVDLLLPKWRNGPTGIVSTQFDSARTRFESVEREESDESELPPARKTLRQHD